MRFLASPVSDRHAYCLPGTMNLDPPLASRTTALATAQSSHRKRFLPPSAAWRFVTREKCKSRAHSTHLLSKLPRWLRMSMDATSFSRSGETYQSSLKSNDEMLLVLYHVLQCSHVEPCDLFHDAYGMMVGCPMCLLADGLGYLQNITCLSVVSKHLQGLIRIGTSHSNVIQ